MSFKKYCDVCGKEIRVSNTCVLVAQGEPDQNGIPVRVEIDFCEDCDERTSRWIFSEMKRHGMVPEDAAFPGDVPEEVNPDGGDTDETEPVVQHDAE